MIPKVANGVPVTLFMDTVPLLVIVPLPVATLAPSKPKLTEIFVDAVTT